MRLRTESERRMRSPVPLTFLEQELDDINSYLCRFGSTDAIGRWGAGNWLSNAQCLTLGDGDNLSDWRIAIEDSDCLATSYCPKIFA